MNSKLGPGHPVPDSAVAEIRYADAAAQAARNVHGVVRLQPGLVGLLRQFAAQAWERATGQPLPDIAGVDIAFSATGSAHVDVRIVVNVNYQASEVGTSVHQAVIRDVSAITSHPVTARIHIVEIDLEPNQA